MVQARASHSQGQPSSPLKPEVRKLTETMFEVVTVRSLMQSPVDWPQLPELSLMGVDRHGLYYLDPKQREESWLQREVVVIDNSEPDFVRIEGPSLHRRPLVHSATSATGLLQLRE